MKNNIKKRCLIVSFLWQKQHFSLPCQLYLEHLHKVTFNDFPKLFIKLGQETSRVRCFVMFHIQNSIQISFFVKLEVRNSFSSYVTCGISPILELSKAHKDSSGGPIAPYKLGNIYSLRFFYPLIFPSSWSSEKMCFLLCLSLAISWKYRVLLSPRRTSFILAL
jgi:hypothetical protein